MVRDIRLRVNVTEKYCASYLRLHMDICISKVGVTPGFGNRAVVTIVNKNFESEPFQEQIGAFFTLVKRLR